MWTEMQNVLKAVCLYLYKSKHTGFEENFKVKGNFCKSFHDLFMSQL